MAKARAKAITKEVLRDYKPVADPLIQEKKGEATIATHSLYELLPQGIKEKIKWLRSRSEPVNMLVMGPTGVGKSTLINALMGSIVAEEHRGAKSGTKKMKMYEGTFMGVKIRVYDTVGFGDTEGRSDLSKIEEMVEANEFDLILICVRMDCRAEKGGVQQVMFSTLSTIMPSEAWERSLVVLTFTDAFLLQGSSSTQDEERNAVINEIEIFKNFISEAVDEEVFSNMPFRISAKVKRELPTTNDWLYDLWCTCVQRCSDEARPVLQAYSVYATIMAWGATGAAVGGSVIGVVGAGVGGAIGASAGTAASPGGGTALGGSLGAKGGGVLGGAVGCAIGGAVGGVLGGVVGCVAAIVDRISTKEKKD